MDSYSGQYGNSACLPPCLLQQLMDLREVEEEGRSFREDASSMNLLLLFQRLLLALIYSRASASEKEKEEGGQGERRSQPFSPFLVSAHAKERERV